MHKSKTHFEQIPVELVKKIAKKDVPDDKDGNDGAEITISNHHAERQAIDDALSSLHALKRNSL